MSDPKERRKYPRYQTDLEVIFYDQKRTKGRILDISKGGCMMALKDGAKRPVGSLITFRVFFEGKAQLEENTMPSISIADLNKKKSFSEQIDKYPHAVKILAIVARHTTYKDQPAMGIQIKDLNDGDLAKWNRFMEKINIEHFTRPVPHVPAKPAFKMSPRPEPKKPEIPKNLPTYTLSFKSLESAARYLPKNTQDTFFVPSKEQPEGRIVHMVMIHPVSKTKLEFNCVVARFGTSPGSDETMGVFVSFHNLDMTLKHQINSFMGKKLYS